MHQTTRILSHAPEAGDLGQWFYCTHSVVQAYATKAGLAYKLPTFRGQWTLQSNQGSQILGRTYCDRVDFATSEPPTAIGQFMGRCQSPRLPISRTCNARGMYLHMFCKVQLFSKGHNNLKCLSCFVGSIKTGVTCA